ncbi:MAG: hypothetical protein IPM13_09600 [Phycisphaerales bacterium]|nr:hypothetical protein [Phycisphaerales bacterium]
MSAIESRAAGLSRRCRRGALLALCIVAAALAVYGACTENDARPGASGSRADPASPYVVSLGNLTFGQPPTPTEVKLAEFLFGAPPEPPLGLVKPVDIAATAGGLLVSDSALQSVLAWSAGAGVLDVVPLPRSAPAPSALALAPNGDRLVADVRGPVVRISGDGQVRTRYDAPGPLRAGGLACVDDQLWVTNLATHRIEVFDLESGRHIRSLGQRGTQPGSFGLPIGIAYAQGQVYVVDMLNARVQVFDRDGQHKRNFGGPGNRIGYFGRPKGVAVGPDGTVFVTDAASQCVHAFDRDGKPLIAFGGTADRELALVLPAGITIWSSDISTERRAPNGFQPAYYVLVAEQIVRPGVRVYAWAGRTKPLASDVEPAAPRRAHSFTWPADNPHWEASKCSACHTMTTGRPDPIAPERVDALCVGCHDGRRAPADPHPIGWAAAGGRTRPPPGWPLVEGRIGCLTCHDMIQHCDAGAVRPEDNSALVRDYDSSNPYEFCRICHVQEKWRVNPHRNQVAGFGGAHACAFCHIASPERTDGGGWTFDPGLRGGSNQLCLGCHTMHADPAPEGHLDREVTPAVLAAMLDAERRVFGTAGPEPRLLVLENGRITCATCHTPHAEDPEPIGLFTSAMTRARSRAPEDEHKGLRVEHLALCRHCHPY